MRPHPQPGEFRDAHHSARREILLQSEQVVRLQLPVEDSAADPQSIAAKVEVGHGRYQQTRVRVEEHKREGQHTDLDVIDIYSEAMMKNMTDEDNLLRVLPQDSESIQYCATSSSSSTWRRLRCTS